MKPWFGSLDRRRRRESEWREELDTHQAQRAEWHRARGLDAEQSRTLAQKQFGGSLRALEAVRAVHVALWWERLVQDCRYALRGFRRSPAFSAVAVATIAIGIGASTAVFSVVDPLLFRRLPYPKDEQLVSVGFFGPVDNNEFNVVSSYLDWRRLQTPFQSMTSMQPRAGVCDLDTGASPRRVDCQFVEANFLRTFGLAPQAGRDLTADDDRPGAPLVALISEALGRTAFGDAARGLGRVVELDEQPVRIVGILPKSFEMPQLGSADILMPEQLDGSRPRAQNSSAALRTFARLRNGVSIQQAYQAMLPLYEDSLRKDVPATLLTEVRLVVRSLRDRQIHDVKLASWMLLGAVLALLLLACANVANLLLARVAARRRELAMRAAIGAGRGRLIRQMLTESLLLGLSGGAAGCGLGWVLVRLFVRLAPEGMVRMEQARVDLRVLGFAVAATVAAALLFGLAPALEQPRAEALAGRGTAGLARLFLRRFLIVAQVALSLMLLTGASLFVRSLWRLKEQPLGFRSQHLVMASFTLRRQRYRPAEAQAAFFDELEQRLRSIPGGGQFALTDSVPPRGSMGRPYSNIRIVGRPPVAANGGMVAFRWVSPDYFRAMGIPILQGRTFLESERDSGDSPVILSASLARRLFGNHSPLGERLVLDGDQHSFPVVGVAADAKNAGVAEAPEPEYYRLRMAHSTRLGRGGVAVFRTALDPAALSRWIRREFAVLDPTLPVDIQTMEERVDQFRERPRFIAAVVAGFAGLGLLLAAVGLYGLLAFLVAQQTREIGVRMALGARPGDVAWRVQGQAAVWVASGVAVGAAGSLALSGAIRGLLFEVSPWDPVSLVVPALILCAVGVAAAWWPSRRAARVDPVVALRCE
ncbi:MAG TPA: ABC transporter permease [Bryobacteraceae bacterium]|nr:ABC transporter permease [Bryobacteraceae bacterium]